MLLVACAIAATISVLSVLAVLWLVLTLTEKKYIRRLFCRHHYVIMYDEHLWAHKVCSKCGKEKRQ